MIGAVNWQQRTEPIYLPAVGGVAACLHLCWGCEPTLRGPEAVPAPRCARCPPQPCCAAGSVCGLGVPGQGAEPGVAVGEQPVGAALGRGAEALSGTGGRLSRCVSAGEKLLSLWCVATTQRRLRGVPATGLCSVCITRPPSQTWLSPPTGVNAGRGGFRC